jgi:MoaA/NifB/PqqE/SkfB family radical SAM enzyme
MNRVSDQDELELLARRFPFGGHAVVDLTSHCNLRCVYCHLSSPGYEGQHIPDHLVDKLIEELIGAKFRSVRFGITGEVTVFKGWDQIAKRFVAAGMDYQFLTNLSRKFSTEQIDLLSRASALTISFDTYDPDLHGEIRRRSSLNQMLTNLAAVVMCAKERGGKPYITQNCVVSAHNASSLPDVVARAPENGIDRIGLIYMIKGFPLDDGGLDPIPIDLLNESDQLAAMSHLDAAVKISGRNGVELLMSTILQRQLDRFHRVTGTVHAIGTVQVPMGPAEPPLYTLPTTPAAPTDQDYALQGVNDPGARRVTRAPELVERQSQRSDPQHMTRNCVSPWAGAEVQVNGDVGPCCVLAHYGGNLRSNSLLAIIDGTNFRNLRRALLQGNLAESHIPSVRNSCALCPLFGEVPISVLRERVRTELQLSEAQEGALPNPTSTL